MLFDHVFVFHPGFEPRFREAGHPSVTLLAHAVDVSSLPEPGAVARDLEVGWVGQLDGAAYETRRRVLGRLADRFRTNDWSKRYDYSGTLETFSRSKIVVNVPIDIWPMDANQRSFEAMAAGALLVNPLPTELEQLGFVAGRHFIGYDNEDEIPDLVTRFLGEHEAREQIAEAGRATVLRDHTYDQRVEKIRKVVDSERPAAPARAWPATKVEAVYFDYFVTHRLRTKALGSLCRLALGSPRAAVAGVQRALDQRRGS